MFGGMAALTLKVRPREEQTAFNLRRWEEVLRDRELAKIEGRVETDRHGRIIMSPPPAPRHGRYQGRIIHTLRQLMGGGEVLPECPISTRDGVRAADVAWVSTDRWLELGNRACFTTAPEICIEVLSPSNSEVEIEEKRALYFEAGAVEVWVCGLFGAMEFFGKGGEKLEKSGLCREFPAEIE